MDKVLRPERLDIDPNDKDAFQEWNHWKVTFQNFVSSLPQEGLNKKKRSN